MGARRKGVKRYKPLLLVDTSAWIHFLRPDGDSDIAREVETALAGGAAFWCQMIQLELWNGARVLAADKDFDLPRTVTGQLQRH